ncbi:helix-turn-helix domain-containing protein [Kitasatospora albolonga]
MDEALNSVRFSGLLREFRRHAGLTQQELADLSALSVRAVRDLESGRVHRPRRETVRLLVATLRLEGARRAAFERAATENTEGREAPPDPALIGREAELAALLGLLREGGRRLVTVTGLPGVGKTRLASAAADRLHRSGWTVNGALAAPDALLLVDCLQDGPPIAELLARHPGLRVLTTAAAPLRLPGERVLPLAPLPAPRPAPGADPADLLRQDAVRLFLARLQHVRPGHRLDPAEAATVAELCRRLDGLPAAIEHAAEWCLIQPPRRLLLWARQSPLEPADSPAAGPVLRAALHQSIGELAYAERELLRHLAGPGRGPGRSFEQLLARTRTPAAELATAVHALLVRGLVRATPGATADDLDSGERFTVPYLVRHALLEATTPAPAARPLRVLAATG